MSLFSLYFPPLPQSVVALRDAALQQLHHNHINNLSTHMQMHHPYLFFLEMKMAGLFYAEKDDSLRKQEGSYEDSP